MVNGIEIFKEHFKGHTDKFILIGGAACDITMSQMGIDFRDKYINSAFGFVLSIFNF